MSRYEPLKSFLLSRSSFRVAITFREIEKVIGGKLPPSARTHRAWWANDATGHSHAKAWLGAGYETEQVDIEGETLVFRRTEIGGMAEAVEHFQGEPKAPNPRSIVGALKGMARIAPGVDITKPALDPEEWEKIIERKYGPARKD